LKIGRPNKYGRESKESRGVAKLSKPWAMTTRIQAMPRMPCQKKTKVSINQNYRRGDLRRRENWGLREITSAHWISLFGRLGGALMVCRGRCKRRYETSGQLENKSRKCSKGRGTGGKIVETNVECVAPELRKVGR
jgi:hypothetical protein